MIYVRLKDGSSYRAEDVPNIDRKNDQVSFIRVRPDGTKSKVTLPLDNFSHIEEVNE